MKEKISFPRKKYQIIYADPPWSYNKKIGQGIADDQYPTMALKDIKELPISNLAGNNCVLFLWATFPMLKEALEVIESWGFEYKTVAFNWVKLNPNGTPFFGIGHYTKSNAEICLLATRGKLSVVSNKISQIVMSVNSKHSSKPLQIYSKIEKLYGLLDRIELFARVKHQGWDTWGNHNISEIQNTLEVMELVENE